MGYTFRMTSQAAFLFDLDGTLVDSVYQHVLAWHEALEREGISLSIWRVHRRIGMSGGLLINMLLRETAIGRLRRRGARARRRVPRVRGSGCNAASPRRARRAHVGRRCHMQASRI